MAVSYDAVPVSTTGLILVWLDEVMCNGTETALSACPHSMWGEHDCSPNTAAGVTCSGMEHIYILSLRGWLPRLNLIT